MVVFPVKPYVEDADFTLLNCDVLDGLRSLDDESVHCVVCSPPYWGLRSYLPDAHNDKPLELGLEPTPEEYVARMVGVFREVRRVLRSDGTLWLNIGDSYASSPPGNVEGVGKTSGLHGANDASGVYRETLKAGHATKRNTIVGGLKPKDLVGIPWKLAFALQADGWYLRSDIIWSKPNPMPESVTDRPTKAHEYLFLLSKSPRYFFDQEAVREKAEWARWGDQTYSENGAGDLYGQRIKPRTKAEIQSKARGGGFSRKYAEQQPAHGAMKLERPPDNGGRNVRSVWEIATQPYPEAHFATYPEELVRRCILAGSPHDGTVLDPFLGSGTTAYVARKLGRRSIGIELNADYCALAARRLQQLSLFSETAA